MEKHTLRRPLYGTVSFLTRQYRKAVFATNQAVIDQASPDVLMLLRSRELETQSQLEDELIRLGGALQRRNENVEWARDARKEVPPLDVGGGGAEATA